jgi:hypothetical protein
MLVYLRFSSMTCRQVATVVRLTGSPALEPLAIYSATACRITSPPNPRSLFPTINKEKLKHVMYLTIFWTKQSLIPLNNLKKGSDRTYPIGYQYLYRKMGFRAFIVIFISKTYRKTLQNVFSTNQFFYILTNFQIPLYLLQVYPLVLLPS